MQTAIERIQNGAPANEFTMTERIFRIEVSHRCVAVNTYGVVLFFFASSKNTSATTKPENNAICVSEHRV